MDISAKSSAASIDVLRESLRRTMQANVAKSRRFYKKCEKLVRVNRFVASKLPFVPEIGDFATLGAIRIPREYISDAAEIFAARFHRLSDLCVEIHRKIINGQRGVV